MNRNLVLRSACRVVLVLLALFGLSACLEGGSGAASLERIRTSSIGGTVSGLTGTVVLQNNSGNDAAVLADGTFTFPKPVVTGESYAVTVRTQPAGQLCTVSNGSGAATANVTSVAVMCVNAYSIGGTVSGLNGMVVLQSSGGNDVAVSEDGEFQFTTPVAAGEPYAVTVRTQPAGQICKVGSGAGTSMANVTAVTVSCVNSHSIGGTVSGVSGMVVLQNNGGNDVTVSASGTFTFATPVASGESYSVTVLAHPVGQFCAVDNGSGTVVANISAVAVNCVKAYSVGGAVSGLSGTVVLQNNGGNDVAVSASGAFKFTGLVPQAGNYAVAVRTQPVGQFCTASNATGAATANVTTVAVGCVNAYNVGGTITGLTGTLVLQNNGGNDATISADGAFTFAVLRGAAYAVTVRTQPTGQGCTVTNGTGKATANVTDVTVSCVVTRSIGGAVHGVIGTVVLQNNGGNDVAVSASGAFSFTTPLAVGVAYAVTVRVQPVGQFCTVSNGSGAASTTITTVVVTCVNTKPLPPLPAPPAYLTAISGDARVTLSWAAVAGSTEYRVFRATTAGVSTADAAIATVAATTYDNAGLTNGTSYYFKVVAVNEAGPGPTSAEVSAKPLPALPAVPTNFTATAGDTQVALAWTAVAGATEYRIYRSTTAGVEIAGVALATVTSSSYINTGLTYGTFYYYKLVAANLAGLGPASTEISAKPLPPAPVLSLGFGIKQLQFSWIAMPGAAYYKLMENPDGASGYTQVGGNLVGTNTALDIVVFRHNWANARYLVSACNSSNVCVDSNEVFTVGEALKSIGYVKASNAGAKNYFGGSVALSADGNTLAVGASGEDSSTTGINSTPNDSGGSVGAVYVFTRSASGWSQQAYVKAANAGNNDHFGVSVALSADGNTLAVGAKGEASISTGINGTPNDSGGNVGAVYVFARSVGSWSQQAYIKAANAGVGDAFGISVALSADGNTLAVGAAYEDGNTTGPNESFGIAGAVYVFSRSASTWSQQAYVKASNAGTNDHFGGNVALSADGNTLAVGASGEGSTTTGINSTPNDSGGNVGAVYVFTRSASSWSEQAYVKASNAGSSDRFGTSVALSADGNCLAVGADGEGSSTTGVNSTPNRLASNAGAVYVFARSANSWGQQAYVKASNTGANDYFGVSVALSADGNALAVGAAFESGNGTGLDSASNELAQGAGAAYVFTRGAASWSQRTYIKATNTGGGDVFGFDLALSADGNTLAVGGYDEDSSISGVNSLPNEAADAAGAVYLY